MWLELLVAAVVLLGIHLYLQLRRPAGFPPGPPAVPIFGSLPFLPVSKKESPTAFQDSLTVWAKSYGPVYSMALGHTWIVVLNDHQSLKEAMVYKEIDFAGRPMSKIAKFQNPYFPVMGIGGSTYNKQWALQRKTLHQVLQEIQQRHSHDIITVEAEKLSLELSKQLDQAVDIQHIIAHAVTNVSVKLLFNECFEYGDTEIEELFQIVNDAVSAMFFGKTYLPGVSLTPSYRKHCNNLKEKYGNLTEYIHRKLNESSIGVRPRNLIDSYRISIKKNPDVENRLFQVVDEILVPSVLACTNTLMWCIYFMIANPDAQKKVQEELDIFAGNNKAITVADRANLPYTEATLLETLRLSCIVPITLPHLTTKDTSIGNFFIPKDTEVWGNIWHIHHDPDYWPDSLSFKPGRFLDMGGRVVRKHDIVLFGIGNRSCLGENIVWEEMFLMFTRMMQDFSMCLPNGNNLPPPVGKVHITHFPPAFNVFLTKR